MKLLLIGLLASFSAFAQTEPVQITSQLNSNMKIVKATYDYIGRSFRIRVNVDIEFENECQAKVLGSDLKILQPMDQEEVNQIYVAYQFGDMDCTYENKPVTKSFTFDAFAIGKKIQVNDVEAVRL